MEVPEGNVRWIDKPHLLAEAVSSILDCPYVAVDTEYDSFRYFREKLCLIQVATKDGCYLVDPLSNLDIRPMGMVFANSGILKIFHAGENNVRLLKRDYGFSINNVFDTAKAAALIGEDHLSLAKLVRKYLGVEFEKVKSVQRSRWDKRPLSETQIVYATYDVRYLFDLYCILEQELALRRLLNEAKEAFEAIANVEWQDRAFKRRGYKRIAISENLTPIEERRLSALYEWRYFLALDLDMAPFMILTDKELLAVAKGGIEALSAGKRKKWGDEIVRSIAYFRE